MTKKLNNRLGPREHLTNGQINELLNSLTSPFGSFSRSTRAIRDRYLHADDAARLRRCFNAVRIYANRTTQERKANVHICRHIMCAFCGPWEHHQHASGYSNRIKSLSPDGKSLDVIHHVFTVPDWLWPTIMRKNPAPPTRQAESVHPSAPHNTSRRKRTTSGLEAFKEAVKGTLADIYCEGNITRARVELGVITSLHVFGDKPPWPEHKPHLDVVLIGYRHRDGKIERLPTLERDPNRADGKQRMHMPYDVVREYYRKRLRKAFLPHARTIEEHADLKSEFPINWHIARGTPQRDGGPFHGDHRIDGHAYHTIKYSTRPMFCLKYARLIEGPTGALDTLEYRPDIGKTGHGPTHRVPIAPAMQTLNQARHLLQGSHVHTVSGNMARKSYANAMKALGRQPVGMKKKSTGEWILDRIAHRRPDGTYHDPGPIINPHKDSSTSTRDGGARA